METSTHQQSLNEMMRQKIQNSIEKTQPKAKDAFARLVDEGKISRDFVKPLGIRLRNQSLPPVVTFGANGHVAMNVVHEGQVLNFGLHDNAVGQVAEKLDIPSRYLKGLAGGEEWERQLASTILNETSSWASRQRVLLRTVGGQVRGVLSDSYKRLNSILIVEAFLQEVDFNGAVLIDGYMDETRMWFETIYPEPFDIPTEKNGIVTFAFGGRYSTSDYGDGASELRSFMKQGACLNGMVRNSVMRSVHLGSRLPDNIEISNRTYQLDTRTQASAVKDITRGLFDKETLMLRIAEIQNASLIEVDLQKELKNLSKAGMILKGEGEEIEKIFMKNKPEDGVAGESTLLKLTQGITAHARTVNERRQRELQEIAGSLMDRTAKMVKVA